MNYIKITTTTSAIVQLIGSLFEILLKLDTLNVLFKIVNIQLEINQKQKKVRLSI